MDTLLVRFLSKVQLPEDENENACWIWTGNKSGHAGYGGIRVGQKVIKAHRVSYELFKGPIPIGHVIRHTCDNPPCVRPDHLLTGTHVDNMRDKMERGRYYNGSDRIVPGLLKAIRQDYWNNLTAEEREIRIKNTVDRIRSTPSEVWSAMHKKIWASSSPEQRMERITRVAEALKGKPFTVEHLDNLRLSLAKFRGKPPRFIPPRKLPVDQIPAILEKFSAGMSQDDLAKEFHVSRSLISKITRRMAVERSAGYGTTQQSVFHEHGNSGKIRSLKQRTAHATYMRERWATGQYGKRKRKPNKTEEPELF